MRPCCDISPSAITVCSNSGRTDMHNTTHRGGRKNPQNLKPGPWLVFSGLELPSFQLMFIVCWHYQEEETPCSFYCSKSVRVGGLIVLFIRPVIAIKKKNSQFNELYSSRTSYCQQTWMRGASLIIFHTEKRKNNNHSQIASLN